MADETVVQLEPDTLFRCRICRKIYDPDEYMFSQKEARNCQQKGYPPQKVEVGTTFELAHGVYKIHEALVRPGRFGKHVRYYLVHQPQVTMRYGWQQIGPGEKTESEVLAHLEDAKHLVVKTREIKAEGWKITVTMRRSPHSTYRLRNKPPVYHTYVSATLAQEGKSSSPILFETHKDQYLVPKEENVDFGRRLAQKIDQMSELFNVLWMGTKEAITEIENEEVVAGRPPITQAAYERYSAKIA